MLTSPPNPPAGTPSPMDVWPWTTNVRVDVLRLSGGRLRPVDTWHGHNIITDVALNRARDVVGGLTANTLTITQVGWGSGTTAPAAGDTALESEDGRKVVTSTTALTAGVVQTICVLSSFQANGQIDELGWFTADGLLVSRVAYSRLKDELETLQITRTDTFGRA